MRPSKTSNETHVYLWSGLYILKTLGGSHQFRKRKKLKLIAVCKNELGVNIIISV